MAEESYQEKTEPASDRKREEARGKGKVVRSVELNSALVLLFGLLVLYFGSTALVSGLASITRTAFTRSGSLALTAENVHHMVSNGVVHIGVLIAPIVIGFLVIGLAAGYLQVGFMFSPKAMQPSFEKMNPLTGMRKILLSRRSVVELAKSIVKIVVVGMVAYGGLQDVLAETPTLVDSDPAGLLGFIGQAGFSIGLRTGLAFLVLAAVDYFYQRFEFEKEMRMSKEELKEETKSTEGDPQVKSRVRSIQRRIAYRRMMQDVPKADVVVTNPTHLAVALRYDVEKMNAPTVVAKGADLVALKIKEIALAHRIPVVEDRPLAQALYRSVEVGGTIPEKLFQAVAQLLAYIYRLRQGQPTLTMN
jgi:flagellar biosynthetic protein FlhB